MGIEEPGSGDAYVRRTTNGLLLIPKDKPCRMPVNDVPRSDTRDAGG
jgi:hypothetical protein